MSKANVTVYGKDHPDVVRNEQRAHSHFVDQLLDELSKQKLAKNKMTRAIGAQAPMTYRMMNPKENITLNTMCRYCHAIGLELDIVLRPTEKK